MQSRENALCSCAHCASLIRVRSGMQGGGMNSQMGFGFPPKKADPNSVFF